MHIFLIIATLCAATSIKLGNQNLLTIIMENRLVLVDFYQPGCSACQQFKKDLDQATMVLEQAKITIGELDITSNGEMAEMFNITETPTVILFIDGVPYKHGGSFPSYKDLEKWAKSLPTKSYILLQDYKSFGRLLHDNAHKSAILICNSQNSDLISTYTQLLRKSEDYTFYLMYDFHLPKNKDEFKPTEFLIVKWGAIVEYEGDMMNSNDMFDFLELHKLPLISEYSEQHETSLFYDHRAQFVLFITEKQYHSYYQDIMELPQMYLGKLVFSYYTGKSAPDLAGYTGLTVSNKPFAVIISGSSKYLYQGDITFDKLKEFIESYLSNSLPIYYKSEKITEHYFRKVLTNVGRSNLNEFIGEGKKGLILYSSLSNKYMDILSMMVEVAKNHSDIKFGLLNTRKNNVYDMIEYDIVPCLMMYEDGALVSEYSDEINRKAIEEFLSK